MDDLGLPETSLSESQSPCRTDCELSHGSSESHSPHRSLSAESAEKDGGLHDHDLYAFLGQVGQVRKPGPGGWYLKNRWDFSSSMSSSPVMAMSWPVGHQRPCHIRHDH